MPKKPEPHAYSYANFSTGRSRGLLAGKYSCWEAQGAARDIFDTKIFMLINNYMKDRLPESNSMVHLTLFMVGQSPEKTKPTVMVVSDDKQLRKHAVKIIQSQHILIDYPGFELGHCGLEDEFKDLRLLGSDTGSLASSVQRESDEGGPNIGDKHEPSLAILSMLSAEACSFEIPDDRKPVRLHFNISLNSHSHKSASSTCGGVFLYRYGYYAIIMAHAIDPARTMLLLKPNDSPSESDDIEFTGIDESDEDDERDKEPGVTPEQDEDQFRSCESELSAGINNQDVVTNESPVSPVTYEDYNLDNYEDNSDAPETCERVGSIVSVDMQLDIAILKITPGLAKHFPVLPYSLEAYILGTWGGLNDHTPIPTSITVRTTHQSEIRGEGSISVFYTRLPGTSNFLKLYYATLNSPLRLGDSGSWVFDNHGGLIGFVVAGGSRTRSCLLLPRGPALRSACSLLRRRESHVS
ncbi:hypothetical protein F4777DRAFT_544649 [Nemania sp. FL0916]|nr:hypothetical protein F4777DRAFT_544649 [Nemania sp. FL0916]